MFRRMLMVVPIAAIAVGGSTACATKKFVRTSVGEVNDKVDSLGRSVEETQERTRQNEGKIAEVDQTRAGGGPGGAGGAERAADKANDAAATAGEHRQRRVTRRPTRSTRRPSGSSTKSC